MVTNWMCLFQDKELAKSPRKSETPALAYSLLLTKPSRFEMTKDIQEGVLPYSGKLRFLRPGVLRSGHVS